MSNLYRAIQNLSIQSLSPPRDVDSGDIVDLTGLPPEKLKIVLEMGAIVPLDTANELLVADLPFLSPEQKRKLYLGSIYLAKDFLNLSKRVIIGDPRDPVMRETVGTFLITVAGDEMVLTQWINEVKAMLNISPLEVSDGSYR